jgi:hypothetical protein
MPATDQLSDKRYFPRWEVQNRVIYHLEENPDNYEARTKDLSCAGACLISRKNNPLNQKVKLTIYLSASRAVSVEGKIVWSQPLDGAFELGVDFENVNLKSQDIILQHAFEFKHADVVKNWFKGWRP